MRFSIKGMAFWTALIACSLATGELVSTGNTYGLMPCAALYAAIIVLCVRRDIKNDKAIVDEEMSRAKQRERIPLLRRPAPDIVLQFDWDFYRDDRHAFRQRLWSKTIRGLFGWSCAEVQYRSARRFHEPGDVETRVGYHAGAIG